MIIPIEVSARHIHLSLKDKEFLFGKNYKLTKVKDLTQPGEFSAKETLDIIHKGKKLKIRIVGPERKNTQIELSTTDAIFLGVKALLRKSGSIKGSPGIILKSKNKELKIKQGVIIPLRHIHTNKRLKKNPCVLVKGKRKLVFDKVQVRNNKNYKLCMHIDTDEGNAAGINKKAKGILL
ncbi:MAG: PduL/EutD family phosphate acyltransferase [Candidatus Pacebacteria bacterium]|nr:PduL/EutD family phosphate acyltransferase [Candidatus Paceibacterota bacterium]